MAQYDIYPRVNSTVGTAVDDSQAIAQAAGAMAIDWSQGATAIVSLTGNVSSFTFSNPKVGQIYKLVMIQDATGSRTWASAPATVKWLNTTYLGATAGTLPTLTTTASKRDSFVFLYDGTNYLQLAQVMNS